MATTLILSSCKCNNDQLSNEKVEPKQGAEVNKDQRLIAKFKTNVGVFSIELFHDKVPNTVSNFATLAKEGFYNGTIFHRVIDGFMIQGGDPEGSGRGGPDYRFADEFDRTLKHAKKGVLSMANAGPNTNGSQFFITLAPTPHLDGRHSVFGEVVEGMEVVEKIGKVETDAQDRPVSKVVVEQIDLDGDWYTPTPFEKIPSRR
mgnify:CR=1 FL=1